MVRKRTMRISVEDYPEHLNPFREEEEKERLAAQAALEGRLTRCHLQLSPTGTLGRNRDSTSPLSSGVSTPVNGTLRRRVKRRAPPPPIPTVSPASKAEESSVSADVQRLGAISNNISQTIAEGSHKLEDNKDNTIERTIEIDNQTLTSPSLPSKPGNCTTTEETIETERLNYDKLLVEEKPDLVVEEIIKNQTDLGDTEEIVKHKQDLDVSIDAVKVEEKSELDVNNETKPDGDNNTAKNVSDNLKVDHDSEMVKTKSDLSIENEKNETADVEGHNNNKILSTEINNDVIESIAPENNDMLISKTEMEEMSDVPQSEIQNESQEKTSSEELKTEVAEMGSDEPRKANSNDVDKEDNALASPLSEEQLSTEKNLLYIDQDTVNDKPKYSNGHCNEMTDKISLITAEPDKIARPSVDRFTPQVSHVEIRISDIAEL